MTRKEKIQQATDEIRLWQIGSEMFRIGAEWADQHPRKGLWDSEKVVEWLRNNSSKYMTEGINYPHYAYNSLVDDLHKAMED